MLQLAVSESVHHEIDMNAVILRKRLADTGGSMAGVFAVSVDGFLCAMKEFNIESAFPEDISRLENEAKILESLPPHPNIVRYICHTRSQKVLRLFMSIYDGTLRSVLDKHSSRGAFLSSAYLHSCMLQVALGLEFLHKHSVIHRGKSTCIHCLKEAAQLAEPLLFN